MKKENENDTHQQTINGILSQELDLNQFLNSGDGNFGSVERS